MKYGLPYKGSKNKLAQRIVGILPQRTRLYDVFCGGCAVTHAAMMGRKFKEFHINDINWMCPQLFKDVLEGKYDHEDRWISREDFFRLKDTDPYVAFVWSFGNNLRNYIYGKDVEPLKKAIHFAVFYADYSLAKDMGHDLTFIDGIEDLQKRYLAVKHYFERFGHFQMQSTEGGQTQRLESLERNIQFAVLGGGQKRLQSFEASNLISGLSKKKVPLRPSEMQSMECQRCVSSIASGTAAYLSTGGGKWRALSPLRLTFPRLRLSLTA